MKILPLTPVSLETFCFEMIKKILPEHEFLPSQALFGQRNSLNSRVISITTHGLLYRAA